MGECWNTFAALNMKINNRSSSVSVDMQGSELVAGNESGVPLMPISYEVKSMCGSDAAGSAASVMGLSVPSSDDSICSRSKAGVVAGAISWMGPDDRIKPCSSG